MVRTSFFLAALLGSTLATPFHSASAEPLRFRLLPQASRILTRISHPLGAVNGEFTLREGEASGDMKDFQRTGRVRLTVDAASYNSGLGLRDQDVQENYLEVDPYPVITFTSTGIQGAKKPRSPNQAWEFIVQGLLELHGIKREVRTPVKMTLRERKITVEGSTRILLKDFNIPIPSIFFYRSGESVEVEFRFVGEQQR